MLRDAMLWWQESAWWERGLGLVIVTGLTWVVASIVYEAAVAIMWAVAREHG